MGFSGKRACTPNVDWAYYKLIFYCSFHNKLKNNVLILEENLTRRVDYLLQTLLKIEKKEGMYPNDLYGFQATEVGRPEEKQ